MSTRFDQDVHVGGTLSATRFTPPASSITNTSIEANAGIAASKVLHQTTPAVDGVELFGPTTTITALTKLLGIARAAGTLVAFEAIITVQATGADRTVTVDLQKSTGGGAFATVLTTTVNITNTTVIRTPVAATINTTSYVDNDIFQAVVTVAGAAGAQAQGLLIVLTANESPQ